MKKIYKAPASRIHNITSKHIISQSNPQSIPVSSEGADPSYDGGGDVKEFQPISTSNLWNDKW